MQAQKVDKKSSNKPFLRKEIRLTPNRGKTCSKILNYGERTLLLRRRKRKNEGYARFRPNRRCVDRVYMSSKINSR